METVFGFFPCYWVSNKNKWMQKAESIVVLPLSWGSPTITAPDLRGFELQYEEKISFVHVILVTCNR